MTGAVNIVCDSLCLILCACVCVRVREREEGKEGTDTAKWCGRS